MFYESGTRDNLLMRYSVEELVNCVNMSDVVVMRCRRANALCEY